MVAHISNRPNLYNVKDINAKYPANITNYEMCDEGFTIDNRRFCSILALSKYRKNNMFFHELNILKSISRDSKSALGSKFSDKMPEGFDFYGKVIASMNPSLGRFQLHHTYLVIGNLDILFTLCFHLKYVMRFKDWQKSVYFVTDNYYSAAYANYHYMLPKDNIIVYNNSIHNFLTDKNMPKFDFAITNPPYGDLHLKFLDKLVDITNIEIKMIHPARWLYAQKPGNIQNQSNKIKEKINNYSVDVKLFNGNSIFKIGEYGYCAITTINKSKSNDGVYIENIMTNEITEYESVFDINPFFVDKDMFNPLKTKIFNAATLNNVDSNIIKNVAQYEYYVNLSNKRGNVNTNGKGTIMVKWDFYTYMVPSNIDMNDKNLSNGTSDKFQTIGTNSTQELNNLKWYFTESKFSQFCLMLVKTNVQLARGELNYIPYFDFTKVSSDEQIYTLLGLTKPEIEFIEKTVDDFRQATAK